MLVTALLFFLPAGISPDSLPGDSLRYTRVYPDSVIQRCHTAAGIPGLSPVEKEVILYTNLLRHDPVRFGEEILRPYLRDVAFTGMFDTNSVHVQSLYRDLQQAGPLPLLKAEPGLNASAGRHADYCSLTGHTGHADFPKRYNEIRQQLRLIKAGENCAYIPATRYEALTFLAALLVDADNAPDYGHRKALLYRYYQVTGVGIRPFPGKRYVLVQHYGLFRYENTGH